MRALVTGGAGFIGSNLVDRLLAEGHSVEVVDNLSSGKLANLADARATPDHEFSFHQMDICDPSVSELIERRAPEVVFHLAAQIDVRVFRSTEPWSAGNYTATISAENFNGISFSVSPGFVVP